MSYTVIESPIDELTLVADEDGVLRALYMQVHRHRPETVTFGPRLTGADADEVFGEAKRQLGEYFAGQRTRFELRTHARGSDFQRAVWGQLALIPYGETISYAELALRVDNPKAVRAVGLANGKNPLSIIVPCHRVVGANGALTGFGGGIERKRFLLDLEGPALREATLWEGPALAETGAQRP